MIQIDQTICVGCGKCAGDCFPKAIELSNHKARLCAPENCIGCGHCIAVCPLGAVSDPSLPMDDVTAVSREIGSDALLGLMRSRRSCRHYRPTPVPDAACRTIIDAARACPTAKNLQATRYITVTGQIPQLLDLAIDTLSAVGAALLKTQTDYGTVRRAKNFIQWGQQRRDDPNFDPLFFHAPLLILFVSQQEAAHDAAAGAAYGELMAAALGLGCLYSGYFTACADNPAIRSLLGLGENERVVRCLVLGYPDITFSRTAPRKPPEITKL